MRIQDRVWEDCPTCGKHKNLIQEEKYGCDYCGKVMGENNLDVDVFHMNHETQRYNYCSWLCVLRGVRRLESDYFINLPMLHFDEKTDGIRAQDFWAAIKEISNDD